MINTKKKSWPIVFLLLLLAADGVLICLSTYHLGAERGHPHFGLDTERGYAEFFQDIKALWAAMLFAILLFSKKQLIFGVAMFLFSYLLIDDAMRVHEQVGLLLVEPLGISSAFGLRASDIGELLFSLSVGTLVIALGMVGYKVGDATAKRVAIHLLIGCFLLGFFGIAVDMAHVMIGQGTHAIDVLFITIEDGGELVMFSFFAWYAYGLVKMLAKMPEIHLAFPEAEDKT